MIEIEQTFWSMMKQLEALAVSQYKKFIPELNTARKEIFLQGLPSQQNSPSDQLSTAVEKLVQAATKNSRLDTLLLQGFTLEILGQAVYRAIQNTSAINESSHLLAQQANTASQDVLQQILSTLRKENVVGDSGFKAFVSATQDVFGALDSMGSLIDETFTSESQLKFDDVLADAVTELLKYGADLGMDRKKLLRHLTSSLMTG
jgi:hypothetical protein